MPHSAICINAAVSSSSSYPSYFSAPSFDFSKASMKPLALEGLTMNLQAYQPLVIPISTACEERSRASVFCLARRGKCLLDQRVSARPLRLSWLVVLEQVRQRAQQTVVLQELGKSFRSARAHVGQKVISARVKLTRRILRTPSRSSDSCSRILKLSERLATSSTATCGILRLSNQSVSC